MFWIKAHVVTASHVSPWHQVNLMSVPSNFAGFTKSSASISIWFYFLLALPQYISSIPWSDGTESIASDAEKLLQSYSEWHQKAASLENVKVFIWRPRNGIGDQLQEASLPTYFHYCLMSSPFLRFEIAPADGAIDIGAWSTGLSSRIELQHQPDRSRQMRHEIVAEASGPCSPDCQYRSYNMTVKPMEALKFLVLQPSSNTLRHLEQALGLPSLPNNLVAIHSVQQLVRSFWDDRIQEPSNRIVELERKSGGKFHPKLNRSFYWSRASI